MNTLNDESVVVLDFSMFNIDPSSQYQWVNGEKYGKFANPVGIEDILGTPTVDLSDGTRIDARKFHNVLRVVDNPKFPPVSPFGGYSANGYVDDQLDNHYAASNKRPSRIAGEKIEAQIHQQFNNTQQLQNQNVIVQEKSYDDPLENLLRKRKKNIKLFSLEIPVDIISKTLYEVVHEEFDVSEDKIANILISDFKKNQLEDFFLLLQEKLIAYYKEL